MPIDLKRKKVSDKLDRLSYHKGVRIKQEVADFLAGSTHAFCADTIAARIDTGANPIMIESVLSHHTDVFSYGKKDGKIYWYVSEKDILDAVEMAED